MYSVSTCALSSFSSFFLCPGIGGGVYLDDSDATLSSCRFEENVAEGSDLFGQLASFGGGLATRGPSHLTTIR